MNVNTQTGLHASHVLVRKVIFALKIYEVIRIVSSSVSKIFHPKDALTLLKDQEDGEHVLFRFHARQMWLTIT